MTKIVSKHMASDDWIMYERFCLFMLSFLNAVFGKGDWKRGEIYLSAISLDAVKNKSVPFFGPFFRTENWLLHTANSAVTPLRTPTKKSKNRKNSNELNRYKNNQQPVRQFF